MCYPEQLSCLKVPLTTITFEVAVQGKLVNIVLVPANKGVWMMSGGVRFEKTGGDRFLRKRMENL